MKSNPILVLNIKLLVFSIMFLFEFNLLTSGKNPLG